MQVLFDSLIRASGLSLLAVGLTMVYSVLRFPNFSHVEFATVGGCLALMFSTTLGLDLVLATVMAVALAVQEAGSADPDAVAEALHEVSQDYLGVTGDKAVDGDGMQKTEDYQPMIYRNGELHDYKMGS